MCVRMQRRARIGPCTLSHVQRMLGRAKSLPTTATLLTCHLVSHVPQLIAKNNADTLRYFTTFAAVVVSRKAVRAFSSRRSRTAAAMPSRSCSSP